MTPRPSRKGDENALKALWREVFGDTDEYIDAFFQNVYAFSALVTQAQACRSKAVRSTSGSSLPRTEALRRIP